MIVWSGKIHLVEQKEPPLDWVNQLLLGTILIIGAAGLIFGALKFLNWIDHLGVVR